MSKRLLKNLGFEAQQRRYRDRKHEMWLAPNIPYTLGHHEEWIDPRDVLKMTFSEEEGSSVVLDTIDDIENGFPQVLPQSRMFNGKLVHQQRVLLQGQTVLSSCKELNLREGTLQSASTFERDSTDLVLQAGVFALELLSVFYTKVFTKRIHHDAATDSSSQIQDGGLLQSPPV